MKEGTKQILRMVGLHEQVNRVEMSRCPTCNRRIDPEVDFRDALSKKEFSISGMCQECQDAVFTEGA